MKLASNIFILFFTLAAFVSCAIPDDIPFPLRKCEIKKFAVEGLCDHDGNALSAAPIDAKNKSIQLYVSDTINLASVKITQFEVTSFNDVESEIIPSENLQADKNLFPKHGFTTIPEGADTRVDFSSGMGAFTLHTFQDYVWMVYVQHQNLHRTIEIDGMVTYAIDVNTRAVNIYMDSLLVGDDYSKLRIKTFRLGGDHGKVYGRNGEDMQKIETYDFSDYSYFHVYEGWEKERERDKEHQWTVHMCKAVGGGKIYTDSNPSKPDNPDPSKPDNPDYKKGEQLRNGGFEAWAQNGKIWYSNSNAAADYWDSSNGGSANYIGSNVSPESTFVHRGSKSAKLETKWAVIKLAAGGLFTGKYVGLIGTNGAKMDWGVPFTEKPKGLKGYMSYSPGAINRGTQPEGVGAPANGELDHYNIFIALTSEILHVGGNATKDEYEKTTTFDWHNDPRVIAYGEVSGNQDDNGQWREFNINLDYHRDETPAYLIILVSSSKWGDYFYGSDQTVMYVDDLELVY